MREIPSTAVQIQEGLYQDLIVGRYTSYSILYSSEGYCFYDKTEVIYREDENGQLYEVPENEVLPNERTYAQWCSTPETTAEELNARFVSVPVDPSYEIVSVSNPTVTE